MNLTKSIKQFLVTRFIDGATIKECAMWYEQKPEKVEALIREALREAHRQLPAQPD